MTLAKLQNPVKSSFDVINDSLKETHSGLNKYSKALDKVGCYIVITWNTTRRNLLLTLPSVV